MEESEKKEHGYNDLVLERDRPSIIWWLLQEANKKERESFFKVADTILEARRHSVAKSSVSKQVLVDSLGLKIDKGVGMFSHVLNTAYMPNVICNHYTNKSLIRHALES